MKGSVRQRGKQSWELKFDLGTDPLTGRRRTKFLTIKATKKADAERELAKHLARLAENTFIDPSKVTVGERLERWLEEHARLTVSARTLERYTEIVRKHLVPAIGALPLQKLSPQHLRSFYYQLRTQPRVGERAGIKVTRPPLSAQTVLHVHRTLSQVLEQAVSDGELPRNVAKARGLAPRVTHREMAIVDQAQSATLLRAAEASPIYMVILLALTCGMRRSEILGLRWRAVDLDARSVSVAEVLEQTRAEGLRFKPPKTDKSRRTISLPAMTVEALRRHRVRQAEQKLGVGPAWREHDLVCCHEDGLPLDPRQVSKSFKDLARRLRLGIRFHDLRHSHISHLLAAGVHPKVASERAGHSKVGITLDIYSHVMPGMQEDAANRIDAALRAHLER